MAILGMVYYWVCHINEYLTNELMNSWKIMDMILTFKFWEIWRYNLTINKGIWPMNNDE